ncbi:MAG: hypothetical protein VXW76_06305 [Actinomycetota bacterium]|nr:hypothetical protein [Actinomycetota bacterium]
MSTIFDKLKNLELPENTVVSLSLSEGTDVFVHNETEVETALSETDVVSTFSDLVATPGLNAKTRYGTNIIEALRDEGLLDDYERGTFTFAEYISDAITDNFYDVDLIDYSTEKYDHKRGFCTLTADVVVPLGTLLETRPFLGSWEVSVPTENGTLVLG